MSELIDPDLFESQIRGRILEKVSESLVIEQLIDQAGLCYQLLNVGSDQQSKFSLSLPLQDLSTRPKIERLTLVYPQSFAFEWRIKISGYFNLSYSSLTKTIPHPVEPFMLIYSGIIVPNAESANFKNEKVELIEGF